MAHNYKDFDEALERLGPHLREPLKGAWIWTHDTLALAQVVARSIFGAGVSPEVVLQVYDRLAAREAAERARMPGEPLGLGE